MADKAFELRVYTFIDSFQPRLAQYIAKENKVYDPAEYDASLFVELAPAMEIHRMIDLVLKRTKVRLGSLVTERQYGLMEVHHPDQGEVIEAGRIVLSEVGLTIKDRAEVKILQNHVIRSVEQDHAIAITGMARGDMALAGDSMLIMETNPAAYLAIACNEALKAARVKLNMVQPWGATGRLIMTGPESEIDSAQEAAMAILEKLNRERAALPSSSVIPGNSLNRDVQAPSPWFKLSVREGLIRTRCIVLVLTVLALCLPLNSASADPAETFGLDWLGRGSASAVTASGGGFSSAFYNPANLAIAPEGSLSLSGLYLLSELEPEGSRTSEGAFGELGIHAPLVRSGPVPIWLGASVLMPGSGFYEIRLFPSDIPTYYRFNSTERRLSLTASAGALVLPWLAVGAGVQMVPTVTAQVNLDLANTQGPNLLEVEVSYRLNPIVGITAKPVEGLSVGVVWRGENHTWLDLPVAVDAEAVNLEARVQADTFFVPHRLTLGVSWDFSETLKAEVDLSWLHMSNAPFPSSNVALFDSKGNDTLGTRTPETRATDILVPAASLRQDGWLDWTLGYRYRPASVGRPEGRANLLDNDEHTFSAGMRFPLWIDDSGLERIRLTGSAQIAWLVSRLSYKHELLPENPGYPSIEYGGFRFCGSIGLEIVY